MKLLVIGGTGFLGRCAVEDALTRGYEITLFNRGLRNPEIFPQVEKIVGDRAGDLSALKGRRFDAVLDTCGYVPGIVRKSAQLLAENVEHYTFVSSQSVYANFETPGIDENHPTQTLTEEQAIDAESITPSDAIVAVSYGELYGPLKARCERAVEGELPGRTLNVRSGLIVGPHDYSDRFTYWVRRVARGGEVLAPGDPGRPIQLVDVRDLAAWLLDMSEKRGTGTFNATGPAYKLTMGATLDACNEASESNATFAWVNDEALETLKVAGWSEMPLWMLPEANPINFFSVDCTKAINAGLKFRPIVETARDTLAWDATRGDAEMRSGITSEREADLLAQWRAM